MPNEVTNTTYQFIVEEGKVYKIFPTTLTNVLPQIQIVGTGSVDLFGSFFVPESDDDDVLQSDDTSTNLNGIFGFEELPNYIKFEENQAGTRQIALVGFAKPEEIIFA